MRAGKLRHSITVERFTESLDSAGTPSFTWDEIHSLKAEILEQSVVESVDGRGATDAREVVFRTRYNNDVTTADRILFRGVTHNIKTVSPDGRFLAMEIRTSTLEATE